MALLCAVLCLYSCQDEPAPTPEPMPGPNPNEVTFSFSNENITSTSIELTVTPSILDVNYYIGIVDAATIEGKDATAIINDAITSDDFKVRKGVQIYGARDLNPDTEYAVVCFAYGTESAVTRHDVRTLADAEPVPNDEFDISIEVSNITATSATATATPSSSANHYFFRVITKMELTAMGIYNNDMEIFNYIRENQANLSYITQGTKTLECQLYPEMEYIAIAFNAENFVEVEYGYEKLRLFRYEFETPEAPAVDPSTLFTTSNLQVTHQGFTLDVVPSKGEDSFWGYYIWTKESYDDTYEKEAKNNIVMRSYWGLANIAHEQGYYFGEFIQDYLGQFGSSTIVNYEPLKNDTEYVVVMFYMDPEVADQTVIYDYNYVAVEFKTLAPTADAPLLFVSEPVVVDEGYGSYSIQFNVKTDDTAVVMKTGAQYYDNCDFARYWDPNDWSQIQAFFMFREAVKEETLEQAKSSDGCTIVFTTNEVAEYVFFFEVINSENSATQYGYHLRLDQYPQN